MPNYPQMPPLTQDEIASFLTKPLLAKISTLNGDGSIHLTPLLFMYLDGDILLGTQAISRKARNVRRNSTATVLIDDAGPPARGVIIYGTATLDDENVIEKRAAIFEKYGRPFDQALALTQALANKWEPAVIRVKPDRMVSYDYGKGSLI